MFNLAMRMLAHRQDAEDATQEILIKIITHLSTIRAPDSAGAWAYRIATRHLVKEARLGRVERMRFSFKDFTQDLEQGKIDPSHLDLTDVEYQLALKEVKTGCTLAMLVCLSRALRISYILGDIFELTDTEASAALEIPAGTYRQRLRRARVLVSTFMQASCGLQTATAPCRCDTRIGPALATGRILQGTSVLDKTVGHTLLPKDIRDNVAKLEAAQRSIAILRSNPEFSSSLPPIIEELMK